MKRIVISLVSLSLFGCGSGSDDSGTGGGAGAGTGGSASGGSNSGGTGGAASGGGGGSGGAASGGGGSAAILGYPTRITSGDNHNCVIEKGGAIFCWGNESSNVLTPPAGTFTQISVWGDTGCGVDTTGKVTCWGDDSYVRMGEPTALGFKSVAVSNGAACALDASGKPSCWGWPKATGGTGVVEDAPTTAGFERLIRGAVSLCAMKGSAIECWGFMDSSGVPSSPLESADAYNSWCSVVSGSIVCGGPGVSGAPVSDLFAQVSVGGGHACGLSQTGHAYCWGQDTLTPPADETFVELSGGDGHACGITTAGKVQCWGVGSGPETTVPKDITVF